MATWQLFFWFSKNAMGEGGAPQSRQTAGVRQLVRPHQPADAWPFAYFGRSPLVLATGSM
jgi:hypothetical protein